MVHKEYSSERKEKVIQRKNRNNAFILNRFSQLFVLNMVVQCFFSFNCVDGFPLTFSNNELFLNWKGPSSKVGRRSLISTLTEKVQVQVGGKSKSSLLKRYLSSGSSTKSNNQSPMIGMEKRTMGMKHNFFEKTKKRINKNKIKKQKKNSRVGNQLSKSMTSFDNNYDEENNSLAIMEERIYHVSESQYKNLRIDRFLHEVEIEYSRSYFGDLCSRGCVLKKKPEQIEKQNKYDHGDNNNYDHGKEIEENEEEVVYVRKSDKVRLGETYLVRYPATEPTHVVPESIPLDILYEDEYMIAINKDAGMVVHPAAGNWNGTLANALMYHFLKNDGQDISEEWNIPLDSNSMLQRSDSDSTENTENTENNANTENENNKIKNDSSSDSENQANNLRPGIVHRLDKGTSGVIIAAKTAKMQALLSNLFAERAVKKQYLAVCIGNPGKEKVTIDVPIGRSLSNRQAMAAYPIDSEEVFDSVFGKDDDITKDSNEQPDDYEFEDLYTRTVKRSRHAISTLKSIAHDGKLSCVEVDIETGRTHQIRVHTQHHRTPILGDELYGNALWNKRVLKQYGISRPMLHAYSLSLRHPITKKMIHLHAPLPEDMKRIVEAIFPQVSEEKPGWIKNNINIDEKENRKPKQQTPEIQEKIEEQKNHEEGIGLIQVQLKGGDQTITLPDYYDEEDLDWFQT